VLWADTRWGVRTCVGDWWTRVVVFVFGHRLGWADMGLGWADTGWGVRTRVGVFGHGLGMGGHGLWCSDTGWGWLDTGWGWLDTGLGWADTGSPIFFVCREALGDDCAWRGLLVTLAKR
jgi:hypothetical protein